jgi:hypothetical protein
MLEASARYRSDGGRESVADALSAVLDFLDTFDVEGETPDSDLSSALQPLRALVIALRHHGPHPMFESSKLGRPERTHEWAALQALSAVAASHLIDADREKEEACSHVARRLSGRRQPGEKRKPITWKTVERWRDQALEGNPAEDRITALYREYLSLPGLANGKTPEAVADELIAMALEMLPPAR